jgi:hypothetical protein
MTGTHKVSFEWDLWLGKVLSYDKGPMHDNEATTDKESTGCTLDGKFGVGGYLSPISSKVGPVLHDFLLAATPPQ